MTTEQDTMQAQEDVSAEVQPIIPGTTYKTPEEAAKGYQELKALADRQGNELGMTRKMLESLMAKGNQPQQAVKPETPQGPDYDAELTAIDQAIEKLDVDEPGYAKQLSALNRKSREIVKAQVANALTSKFEETLTQYDQKSQSKQAQMEWHKANPDFETPEMQMAIQEHMGRDRYGIMDPYMAYREIQLQQEAARAKQLAAENEDYRTRLKLKSGEAEVGKVVTKTGGGVGTPSKPQKGITGEALDAGMAEAFRSA